MGTELPILDNQCFPSSVKGLSLREALKKWYILNWKSISKQKLSSKQKRIFSLVKRLNSVIENNHAGEMSLPENYKKHEIDEFARSMTSYVDKVVLLVEEKVQTLGRT